MRTPTQTLDVTDSVVRANWQQGGTYDGGGSPWYNPTPNPCELELAVNDARWDPTTIGAYDLTPLATNVKIYLAEEATSAVPGRRTSASTARCWPTPTNRTPGAGRSCSSPPSTRSPTWAT